MFNRSLLVIYFKYSMGLSPCWNALPWPPGGSSPRAHCHSELPSAEVRAAGSSQVEAPHGPAGRARRKAMGLHKGVPSRKLVRGEPAPEDVCYGGLGS